MATFSGTVSLSGFGSLTVGSLKRLRVITPERLDYMVADLVNNTTTSTGLAVSNKSGSGPGALGGVSAATPNTLMQRDAAGRSQVVDPQLAADIATKNYVTTTTIPTTAKGAVNGVASLDSSGFIPVTQISSGFGRNLGSGTTLPSSKNQFDTYNHTGLGCAVRWDGDEWVQEGRATVANRTARNTLLTNYGSIMPVGFVVTQTDYGWIWRKDKGTRWIYAGWEGVTSGDWFSSGSTNQGPVFMYQALNVTIRNNQSPARIATSFVQAGSGDSQREIITWDAGNTQWLINDACQVAITAYVTSSYQEEGFSQARLRVPGGSQALPTQYLVDQRSRFRSYYTGTGALNQPLTWTGYANAGSYCWVDVAQGNNDWDDINNYCLYISFAVLPA